MASRQDHLHSYQFMVQRVVAAVVMRETDPAQSPFRRVAAASMAGLLIAALALAAAAVYGVLAPGGGTGWREPGAVIVERESGARYVYLDGRLHPVLNYASALLIVGAGQAHPVEVGRRALAGVPRGAPLGIVGAPDSLPEPGRLLTTPWALCSAPPAAGPAPDSGTPPESVLAVGGVPAGGRALGDAALLAAGPDAAAYLIWHGHRYRAPDLALVRRAFGWTAPPVPVAAAFAAALEPGPDVAPPRIPGFGDRTGVGGRPVGSVVVVDTQGGARQYAVVLTAGLAPISQVQADLLLSDPEYARILGRDTAEELTQGQYALVPQVSLPAGPSTLPAVTPRLIAPSTVDGAICAAGGVVAVGVPVGVLAGSVPTGGGRYADRVWVPPGRGALVAAAGVASLVTDLGVRYPVPTAQARAALGYPGVEAVRVPAALLDLVPAGRPLDPRAARSPASLTG